ncbi:uncharacterized protein LOC135145167 [Zophobas morio]|uniref:uncharacterized protein LOC135145167 n=1 Tax=Zophobas morio TaxID=2755281 RepID=UPI0030835BC1
MHLVLDGVSCVYVERPYSWENELFGTALIKSSRVLSSTSLWLELAYSSDEPDKDDPLFSIHGGVSFITFFLSFPVMKLLTEHFADSANQTSLNKESSPIMQKQHIPSALLTPSHFLLYSHFVMEGLRFKLVRVRPEVGEFTTLFLSRVNPVSVTFTKRHSSKQLTVTCL